ncbi:MAG TPA: iron ABC transporter permease [Azospirillum sp.]|nr:iron ABC transporter permease [Azospirillum sp.]
MAMAGNRHDGFSLGLRLRGIVAGTGWGTLVSVGLATVIAAPIVAVFSQALTASSGGLWSHLASTVLPDYVVNTLALLVLVALMTLVTGVACAWTVTMHEFPGRSVLQWALLLPLAMPAYVLAYTYTDFFQFTGPLQTALRAAFGWRKADYWFPEIHSLGGAAFVLSAVLYPYVYVLARSAFLEQSACVLEVSRTLGATPFGTFWRVALPLARPALAAGVGYALMETLADFGAVKYFGIDTFTVGIYRTWFALASPVAAAQLASLLLLFVVLVVALERLSRGRMRFHQTTNKYRALPTVRLGAARTALAWLVCGAPVFFGFVLPAAILLRLIWLGGDAAWDTTIARPALNSFMLAASGAVVVVSVGLAVIHGVRSERSRLAAVAARVATLGYATPGTVIAVGILISIGAMGTWFGLPTGTVLGATVFGILYGYLIRFFQVAYGPLESGFAKVSPNIEGAARSLGSGPVQVLFLVQVPLLRASILSAALLVFVDIMKELPATMILRPFNFDTLAVEAFRMASTERLDAAALPALIIVLVGLLPVILLSRSLNASRPGHRS